MKKNLKRKSSSVSSKVKPEQVEEPDIIKPDMAVLIDKIQQQLVILEKKLDILIRQSSERSFEEKHYAKPFQRFDRPRRQDRGNRDNSYRERSFNKAICADCNKECNLPFKPTGDRPVYCKECFAKRNPGNSSKGKYDNAPRERDFSGERHFDRQQGGAGEKKKPFFRKRRERS
ncbi:MAG: CxxC-x17-CxxC domain-containing protein [bacterium]